MSTTTYDGKKYYSNDDDKGRRDDIKTIKARVKTLEAALRDIANRTSANYPPAEISQEATMRIHRIATNALGEQ